MNRAAAVIFLFCALTAQAVTLAWDPNPEPDIAGYILHYGTATGYYETSTNVGNVTNITIATSNLFSGTNFFAVTAYNTSGLESDFSNEVSFAPPPSAPRNFRLSLQSAPTPSGPWQELVSVCYDDPGEDRSRFYRGKVDLQ